MSPISKAALLWLTASGVASALVPRQEMKCGEDNCLRALKKKEMEASAYSFCASLLSTTLATAAIPTFLANCGTTAPVSRLSSACPCFLKLFTTSSGPTTATTTQTTTVCTTPTSTSGTTTSTSTSSSSSSSASSSSTSSSSSSSTISSSSSSSVTSSTTTSSTSSTSASECPAPSTVTITLPGTAATSCTAITVTETAPGSTIVSSFPGSTVTETAGGTTITETAGGTTITETAGGTTVISSAPGSTITIPGPTTTVTTQLPAPTRVCTDPIADGSFENFGPALYPWGFAGSGVSWLVGQPKVGVPGSAFPPSSTSASSPRSGDVAMSMLVQNNTPGGFLRLWQGINNFCPSAGTTPYRLRLWYGTNSASDSGTITFRASVWITQAGSPTVSTLVTASVRTVSVLTFPVGGWVPVEFDAFSVAPGYSGTLHLDISTTRAPGFTIWLDAISLAA